MKRALEIVNSNKIYIKIFKEIALKYKSYGKFTGSFILIPENNEEATILHTFDNRVFEKNKAKINVLNVVKLFEKVLEKYTFIEFLEYVLDEKILTNKEVKKLEIKQENDFYDEILYKCGGHIGKRWFFECINQKKYGYVTIKKYYNQAMKDKTLNSLKHTILLTIDALNCLLSRKNIFENISVFATKITRDPHFFDINKLGGILLKYAICYVLKVDEPNNIEDLNELYYNVGLLKDEISNHTTIYNLKAYKDLEEVETVKAYNLWEEPLQISISNLLKIDTFKAIQNEVFIFENPSVFDAVRLNINRDVSLICTSGQLNLSSYMILDKLSSINKIYYAGDFDPEGIYIAYKIKQRYKEKVEFLFYTSDIYDEIKSEKGITEKRLNIIKNIDSKDLNDIITAILKDKKAAYQEMLIDKYIEFINKDCIIK